MKRALPVLLLLLCTVVFGAGLMELFKLRFEAGDVYPAYSSLRSDPLGTMALFESLQRTPRLTARRDYSATDQLPDGKDTTYLHLATSRYEWEHELQDLPTATFKEIEQFVTRGGRLVITLYPESTAHRDTFSPGAQTTKKDSETGPKKKSGEKQFQEKKLTKPEKQKPESHPDEKALKKDSVSLNQVWGVGFEVHDLAQDENNVYEPARAVNRTKLPLPHTLRWHSGIVCTNLDPAWHTIYARGPDAVVVERRFGTGSVVIATDSYFLSNEAMEKDRHADLLAWLLGPSHKIIFDEAHLGVTERPGVATLMRRYRLYWLIAGLLLLAGLFIWKHSVSLVPLSADQRQTDYVAGKERAAGFVNLLRRNLPPRELLPTCFAEWKKSVASSGKYSAARIREAESVFETRRTGRPVEVYREISRALHDAEFRVPSSGSGRRANTQQKEKHDDQSI